MGLGCKPDTQLTVTGLKSKEQGAAKAARRYAVDIALAKVYTLAAGFRGKPGPAEPSEVTWRGASCAPLHLEWRVTGNCLLSCRFRAPKPVGLRSPSRRQQAPRPAASESCSWDWAYASQCPRLLAREGHLLADWGPPAVTRQASGAGPQGLANPDHIGDRLNLNGPRPGDGPAP